MCRQPVARHDAAAFLGGQRRQRHRRPARRPGGADVLIDFTRPEGTLAHLAVCRELGVARSSAPPASTRRSRRDIADHAEHIAIVMAPNMSVGVNVVLKLLDMAARALPEGYDIEVIEAHHRHKVDAPSGTALAMGEAVARARPRPEGRAVYAREGDTGERPSRSIGFAADARRRHRRRPHGAVRRHRRAHRDHPPHVQPRHLCPGQPARGAFPGRPRRRACTAWQRCSAWTTPPAGAARSDRIQRLLGPERPITRAVAVLLLAMSVSAWVLILWKGWVLRRARPTCRARCPPSGPPRRWPSGRAQLAAIDREKVLLPLLVAARHAPPAGTLETSGRLDSQLTRRLRDALHRGAGAPAVRPGAAGVDRQHRALHRPVRHGVGHLSRAASASRRPAASPSRRSPARSARP